MKKQITLLVFLLFSLSLQVTGQDTKDLLPRLLGNANTGTEFYLTFLPVYQESSDDNRLKIYISAGTDTEVSLKIPGIGYTKTITTVPNDIVEIELTPEQGIPYLKEINQAPLAEQVFVGRGIHISSRDPIIVYAVVRYSYTAEGYLAMPVHMLGKNYLVSSYEDHQGGADGDTQYNSYTACVGAYAKTSATFTMGGNELSQTAGGLSPGETSSFAMNQSDVVLIGAVGLHADLTGSRWISNKPIGVVSGNFCAMVPSNIGGCDHLLEMELPIEYWGIDYPVTPIWGRTKPSIIRIMAAESGTTVLRNGNPVGFLKNSGGVMGEGWLEMRLSDIKEEPVPTLISGDKPIHVTQYNTGTDDDNGMDTDPFQISCMPFSSYYNEVIFNTPGIRGGFGFDNNFINLVYEVTEYHTIPKDMEFAEVKNGLFEWKKLSVMSPHPGTMFPVQINEKDYCSKTIRLPKDGVYKIKAEAPFMAYSYGHSWCDTYGYPCGLGYPEAKDAEDSEAPALEWELQCNGHVEGAVVRDMPEDPDKRSNLGLIYMKSEESYNYSFEYSSYIPGEDREANWSLTPINPKSSSRAVLVFSDRRGNDTTIIVEYEPSLYEMHGDYDFGVIHVNESSTITMWLVSLCDHDVVIEDIILQKSTPEFSLFIPEMPCILIARDSLQLSAVFDPDSSGIYSDSIMVRDTCFENYVYGLTAKAGEPIIDVTHYDFGEVRLGEKHGGEFRIRNLGTSELKIFDYIGLQGKYDVFDEKLSIALGAGDTIRIAPGVEKNFDIYFTPKDTITYSDSLVIISNTGHPEGFVIDSVAEFQGTGWSGVSVNDPDDLQSQISIQPSVVKPGGKITLEFVACKSGKVDISMYDISGHLKSVLNNSWYESGRHSCEIEAPMLSPGVYLININMNNSVQSKRIIVE